MACGIVGLASSPITKNGPPSFATSFGISDLVIFDDFKTKGTIDSTNSLASGFNWYLLNWPSWQGNNSPGFVPANTNSYSCDGSVLTVTTNPSNPANGGMFCTMGYLGSSAPRTVRTFPLISGSKPFYIEGRFNFTIPGSNDGFCPDFWMQDLTGILCQIDNSTPSQNFGEIDLFEANAPDLLQNVHDWSSSSSSQQDGANGSGWTNGAWHTVGVLMVPAASNGGTGLVRWYIDRVQSRSDVTWSPAGTFSCIENGQFVILFSNAQNTNFQVDYIAGWVAP